MVTGAGGLAVRGGIQGALYCLLREANSRLRSKGRAGAAVHCGNPEGRLGLHRFPVLGRVVARACVPVLPAASPRPGAE